jgi:hypothetical protein
MSEKVKVTVIKGSIGNAEVGAYELGDVFETTRDKIGNIDPSFIQVEPIIMPDVASLNENPLSSVSKKRKASTCVSTSDADSTNTPTA